MKKRFVVLGAALAVALALGGCAMTPAKLLERSQQAAAKTPLTESAMDMNITMGLTEPTSGVNMDMDMSMTGNIKASYDPMASYAALDMTIGMMGMSMPMSMETYMIEEDGKFVCYTGANDIWTATEMESAEQAEKDENSLTVNVDLNVLPAEELAIDEEVTEWNGTKAACLTGTVTGEALQGAITQMMGSMAQSGTLDEEQGDVIESLDLEKISADLRLYIDTSTYLPMREEVVIHGMDEALAPLWEEMDLQGVGVSIGDCTLNLDCVSYEPGEAIAVPDEVKQAAARWESLQAGDPDNGDGTYTIQEDGVYMDVATPEGYTLTESDYDHVTFVSANGATTVEYAMWDVYDGSGEAFFMQMVDETTELMSVQAPAYQPMETTWLDENIGMGGVAYQSGTGTANAVIYCWADLDNAGGYGEHFVLMTVVDGNDEYDADLNGDTAQALFDGMTTSRYSNAGFGANLPLA